MSLFREPAGPWRHWQSLLLQAPQKEEELAQGPKEGEEQEEMQGEEARDEAEEGEGEEQDKDNEEGAHPEDAHSVMLSSVLGMTTMTTGRTIQMGPFSACLGRRLYRFVGQWL